MANFPDGDQRNIARLMVRRHLRSWLRSDVISEDFLIGLMLKTAREHPDIPMREVATRVDGYVQEVLSLVLGRDAVILTYDPGDDLGLDPS